MPDTDKLLDDLVDYTLDAEVDSTEAIDTARHCLVDAMGCALMAQAFPACTRLLGPIVPDATMEDGSQVPGTSYRLDPVNGAFNLGALIRWLDYNDTWLAAEWGHPSDNYGGILAVADYLCRQGHPVSIGQALDAAVRAYEIQGVIALENAFNRVGLDHVILVRIATTAVAAKLLGANREQCFNAISNAWLDGGALRTYRHFPNTGSRKSWAAGDATSRGVRLALMAMRGEMGYATALSAPGWGFEDVVMKGKRLTLGRSLGTYVMENILFKISFPAEFHAQTAVECALALHPQVAGNVDRIEKIVVQTQESAVRIIDKRGPLHNPADRDHCLQYMIAVPLLHGRLVAEDYEDQVAADPRIDNLREKMEVVEYPAYTRDYLDADKRSIGNSIQLFFTDGSCSDRVAVEYPIGHRRRRDEGVPLLKAKFAHAVETRYSDPAVRSNILNAVANPSALDAMPVDRFMDLFPA